MNDTLIEVHKKAFDIDYYTHMIRKSLYTTQMSPKEKEIKLRLLLERAYEQGIQHGKLDKST